MTATVDDDDTATLDVSLSSVLLREGGAPRTFTVALEYEPNADVTVAVSSGDTGAVTVSPASLTFTSSNYSRARQVTVTPVDDGDSTDEGTDISFSASGGIYDSVKHRLSVTVIDNDASVFEFTPASLTVNEGSTGTFTVKLKVAPSRLDCVELGSGQNYSCPNVTEAAVSLKSSDTSNVTVSPSSLTFTASNYGTAQTVTVTAIEDADFNDERVSINFSALGVDYSRAASSVAVSVVDRDRGYEFSTTSLNVTEQGSAGTFTVALNKRPSGPVTVSVRSGDTGAVRVSPSSLNFTASNYATAQTVTVTAIGDRDSDDESVSINLFASGDNYGNAAGTVAVRVTDDDSPVLDLSSASLRLVEQTTGTFTVKLRVAPSQSVTVSLASSDTGGATVSPSSLTFTSLNYDTEQTVTVTAIDDADSDDESVDISLSASGGNYDGVADKVTVTVVDNEAAALYLSAGSLKLAERATGSFTVKLSLPPSEDVTVSLTSADTSSVTVSPSSLTFTPSNYAVEQTVAAVAIEDGDSDDERVNINLSASGGGYDNVTGRVTVATDDNDVGNKRFRIHGSRSISIAEQGNAFVHYTLEGDPDPDVIVSVRSSDQGIVRLSPATGAYGRVPKAGPNGEKQYLSLCIG